MATITGSEVLAQSLKSQGVDTLFYLMGGPMLETEAACIQLGIRAIDTRHEQAAALAAHAWTRVTRRPGVCMGCSGPGTTNLVTGVANAFTDCAPLVAIGGAGPPGHPRVGGVQENDPGPRLRPGTHRGGRGYHAPRPPPTPAAARPPATAGRPPPPAPGRGGAASRPRGGPGSNWGTRCGRPAALRRPQKAHPCGRDPAPARAHPRGGRAYRGRRAGGAGAARGGGGRKDPPPPLCGLG